MWYVQLYENVRKNKYKIKLPRKLGNCPKSQGRCLESVFRPKHMQESGVIVPSTHSLWSRWQPGLWRKRTELLAWGNVSSHTFPSSPRELLYTLVFEFLPVPTPPYTIFHIWHVRAIPVSELLGRLKAANGKMTQITVPPDREPTLWPEKNISKWISLTLTD